MDDQVVESYECQVREDLHYDNSKISASQLATIPEQPTTSGHDYVQQLPEDKNTQSTQKAALQKPYSEQCSASEHHNPTINQHNQVEGDRLIQRDSPIVLIGNSIIKNIIFEKMSQRKVYKNTYSGKTAEQIATEVENIDLHKVPPHVIIHAGTNNLPQDSSDACIENIDNLCLSVQNIFTNAKIGVSGIIVRDDISVKDKIEEVNEGIQELCRKRKYIFIDNSNIQLNALNGSKLHFKARGSALLASGFIEFLRGDNPIRPFNQRRSENFQLTKTLRQMKNLIRRISMQT